MGQGEQTVDKVRGVGGNQFYHLLEIMDPAIPCLVYEYQAGNKVSLKIVEVNQHRFTAFYRQPWNKEYHQIYGLNEKGETLWDIDSYHQRTTMQQNSRENYALALVGCSVLPVYYGNNENPDRFALAEQYGQFVVVNQSVDCKGTKVTIEKILLDKTHTFMIAKVDGEIKGDIDYLTVDLFGDQDQELGRSTFSQKLPAGKTLLTFDALGEAPIALRLEFFGGPVGYSGNEHRLKLQVYTT